MFEELPDSSPSFYNSMLIHSIAALKLNTYLDNFDASRFNFDGNDHSKEFNAGERAFFFDWFVKNHESLYAAYSQLADDASKRLYLHLIAYRLAGHFSIKLPLDFVENSKEFDEYMAGKSPRPASWRQPASSGNCGITISNTGEITIGSTVSDWSTICFEASISIAGKVW